MEIIYIILIELKENLNIRKIFSHNNVNICIFIFNRLQLLNIKFKYH